MACGATQVLLLGSVLPRRADTTVVIGIALLASTRGAGYRRHRADLAATIQTNTARNTRFPSARPTMPTLAPSAAGNTQRSTLPTHQQSHDLSTGLPAQCHAMLTYHRLGASLPDGPSASFH